MSHPWEGTQHCLRLTTVEEKKKKQLSLEGACCNDHTGCCWNDGHNTCTFKAPKVLGYDSPLAKRSSK